MGADADAESQFGPYLVYERLGVGGMATVHRALERGIEGFERIVALKRLLPHLAEDASFIKSFVREAKLASLLHHVNVVQIYELGRVGTEYFISMEYIDGRDVRRILRHARRTTGAPPLHVTVGLLTQLCDALDYAHNKTDEDGHPLGLVHRDVSPSNLLITTQGHLKVIDFGIAKAQSQQLRTQTGRVKGKLAYMAPEAIAGRELDARSDLFAAGVIAHELLTARPLFASKNEYQTLMKVQRGEILRPSQFNQACPPEMDAIVLRALAREPDERYPSAAALREDLAALRRQYKLQAGFRDVAKWIDWAFTLEAPGGFNVNTLDQTGSAFRVTPATRTPTPRPKQSDEDAAVEIAWGGGDAESEVGPVVLDDVPDVSEKHLAANGLGFSDRLDDDDIPAHTPSHGALGSSADVLSDVDSSRAVPLNAASTGRMSRSVDLPFSPSGLSPSGLSPSGLPRDHDRNSSSSQQLAEAHRAAQALAEAAAMADDPTGKRAAAPDRTEPGMAPAPDDGALVDDAPAPPPVSARVAVPSGLAPSGRLSARLTPALPAPRPTPQPATTAAVGSVPPAFDLQSRPTPVSRPSPPSRQTTRPGTAPAQLPSRPGTASSPPPSPFARSSAPSTSASAIAEPYATPPPPASPFAPPRPRTSSAPQAPLPDAPSAEIARATPSSVEALVAAGPTAAEEPEHPDPPTAVRIEAAPEAEPQTNLVPPPGASYSRGARPSKARPTSPPPRPSAERLDALRANGTGSVGRLDSLALAGDALDPARTQPGMQAQSRMPAARSQGAVVAGAGYAHSAGIDTEGRSTAPRAAIGAGMLQHSTRPRRWWIPVVALALAGGGAAVYAMVTRSSDPTAAEPAAQTATTVPSPRVAPAPTGNVKFVTEPVGAEIAIEGTLVHAGTPWATDLTAGPHSVEIRQSGYKSWLTSIDVESNQNQLVRVVLEPLGKAAPADASLAITTTPAGLEVVVDNKPLAEHTPVHTTLAAGNHVLAVRRAGVEVWRQEVEARPSAVYEFSPTFAEPRAEQPLRPPPSRPHISNAAPTPAASLPSTTTNTVPPPSSPELPGADTNAPVAVLPPPIATPPALTTPPPPVVPPPPIVTPPAAPQPPTQPVNVAASAVTKLSGPPPNITQNRYDDDLPAVIVAKVCIDTSGHVQSASVVTKLESSRVGEDIRNTLRTWVYATYKRNGTPTPACFFVSFRTK